MVHRIPRAVAAWSKCVLAVHISDTMHGIPAIG